jgi:hypothetical protein
MLTEGVSYLKCALAGPFLIVRAVRRNNPSQITSNCVSISCICTVREANPPMQQSRTQYWNTIGYPFSCLWINVLGFFDFGNNEGEYIYSLSKMSSAKTDDDPPMIGMHLYIERERGQVICTMKSLQKVTDWVFDWNSKNVIMKDEN